MLAVVASQFHKLKVVGSSPTPATNHIFMEDRKKEKTRDKKTFTVFVVKYVRDVVDLIHEYQIPKEDIVSILNDGGDYIVFCYK